MSSHTVDLADCPRCGRDHYRLLFEQLDRPVSTYAPRHPYSTVYEWWASCPDTGEPILMEQYPEKAAA